MIWTWIFVHLTTASNSFAQRILCKNNGLVATRLTVLSGVFLTFVNYFNLVILWEAIISGPEVIKLFSCSTQLSTKFQLLIETKLPTNKEVYCFKSLRCCIYHAYKCLNANNCWHFNIYEQDKFCAQLSWAWKKFYNLGPGCKHLIHHFKRKMQTTTPLDELCWRCFACQLFLCGCIFLGGEGM